MAKAGKRVKKRKSLDPSEKERRFHMKEIRTIFINAGFIRLSEMSEKEFEFKGRKSDFDDLFLYENVLVLVEYTTIKPESISSHLFKKKVVFDHILDDPGDFIDMLTQKFELFKKQKSDLYDNQQYKIKILYCSKNTVNQEHKDQVPRVNYFDYHIVKYFSSLTNNIRKSSIFEILRFFELDINDVGENCLKITSNDYTANGTILPEAHSNFDSGFKVISFYIYPAESGLRKSRII